MGSSAFNVNIRRSVYPWVVSWCEYYENFYQFKKSSTAWKVSKYGVISGRYFPAFGLNTGKYGPEITAYLDAFHAVFLSKNSLKNC